MKEVISVLRSIEQLLRENNQLLRQLVPVEAEHPQMLIDRDNKQELCKTAKRIMMFNPGSLLFTNVTLAYYEEALEKTGNKKSARRLSINLGKDLSEFFQEQLENIYTVEAIDGLLVFMNQGVPFASVRVITDLGYCRGVKFYEVVDDIVRKSQRLGIRRNAVFVIVCSLWNSLEKQHLEEALKMRVRIKDVLSNRDLLAQYLGMYVAGIGSLESPHEHIFFLGVGDEAHPNLKANELLVSGYPEKSEEEILLEIAKYPWLSSIDDLLDKISLIGKEA